jgi:hypothetical protein
MQLCIVRSIAGKRQIARDNRTDSSARVLLTFRRPGTTAWAWLAGNVVKHASSHSRIDRTSIQAWQTRMHVWCQHHNAMHGFVIK